MLQSECSYFRHTGRLSSRRHTGTSRRPSARHYSGHFYSHSLQRKHSVRQEAADKQTFIIIVYCWVIWTLVAVDSIFPALAGFAGRPIETFVALTDSRPVGPVRTRSVTEARPALWPGTRLTVLPKKPPATPANLETADLNELIFSQSFSLCFISELWRTMWVCRQDALQPMVSSRSSSNIRVIMHFFLFTDFCTKNKLRVYTFLWVYLCVSLLLSFQFF